ncbi:MAG: hypothetical protein ACI94Y_000826 [Maribacter sp.]|jgi:hypothetical protein
MQTKPKTPSFFHDFIEVHKSLFFLQYFKKNIIPSTSTIVITFSIYTLLLLVITLLRFHLINSPFYTLLDYISFGSGIVFSFILDFFVIAYLLYFTLNKY